MQEFIAEWDSGRRVRWRSLTWAEYKNFSARLRYECPAGVYADLYRAVLLQGPPLDGDPVYQAPAGLVDWIARAMLEENPFNGEYKHVKRAVEMKRTELKSDFLEAGKAIIAGLFRYTFEEIEQWDAETFFERLAAAEFVSGRKIEPGNPDKKKGKKKVEQKQLTAAQQQVIDRVAQRDRMPMAAEETIIDPEAGEVPVRIPKPQMTPTQQRVAERVQKLRAAQR